MATASSLFGNNFPALQRSVSGVEGDFTKFTSFFQEHSDQASELFKHINSDLANAAGLITSLKKEKAAAESMANDLRVTNEALRSQLDEATKLRAPTPAYPHLQMPPAQSPAASTPAAMTPATSPTPSPTSFDTVPAVPRARAPDVSVFPTQSTGFGRQRQDEYENWRSSLRAKMVIDSASFPRAVDRVLYTTQRLTGEAYMRVRPLVDDITTNPESPAMWPRGIRDFDGILKILDPVYVTIDTFAQAQRDYEKLLQGKTPYAAFIAEFTRLADMCELSARHMVSGLNQKVSTALSSALVSVVDRPAADNFEAWEALYRTLSNNILDSKHRAQVAGAGSSNGQRTGAGDPMDLDAISSGGKRGPLTDAERERRKKNNLCLYCGDAGHYATACTKRPPGQGKA